MNKEISNRAKAGQMECGYLEGLVFLVHVYQWATSLDKDFFFSQHNTRSYQMLLHTI